MPAPPSPARRAFVVAAAAGLLPLAGCVVAPVGPVDPYYGGEVVHEPPPPPRAEVYGVAPVAGWIWLSGYWHWGGARYAWVPGRWAAPRPGHYWQPHHWYRHGHGWRRGGGHWRRG